jgi:hypothetical protein
MNFRTRPENWQRKADGMFDLLVFREKLKTFFGKYDRLIIPAVKFIVVFSALNMINRNIGYMKGLKNPVTAALISLICCLMPYGGICWVTAGFLLMHIFAVSPEMTLITAIFLLVTALLYYGFQPGDSYLLILTPMMFAFRIPYVIPLLVGLGGKLVSVVPVSCGIVLYYIFLYIKQNAAPLTHDATVDITQKYVQMVNGIITNKTMLLMIVAFAITLIVVFIIRNLSINYSWIIAIISGIVAMLTVILAGDFFYDISIQIIPLLTGVFISAAVAAVYHFFVFNVDYSRTEYTQFEDDDYYYYVKAVPKISVSARDVRVQKINPRKNQKHTAEEPDGK